MLLELPTKRRELVAVLRIAIPVWTLFGLACTASALWQMRTHGHSPLRLATYEVLVWNGWAAGTLVVIWIGRRLPLLPFSLRACGAHVAGALVLGALHHVWWSVLLVELQPFDAMGTRDLWRSLRYDFADRMFLEGVVYFAVLGVSYAVDYQRRLRDRELRAAQLEASLAQAKLTALELQLQPHFLFNTLHAIGGLVRQGRGGDAVSMIAGLSDLLRYSLDHAGKHLVTLDQEVAIVRRYLDIQVQRFSDRLAVSLEVSADVLHARVPALLLQPLVENAIYHGAERTSAATTVELRAERRADRLAISIANRPAVNGAAGEGIGIANTRARLHQLFGDRHAFTLERDGDRMVATVSLPFDEAPA